MLLLPDPGPCVFTSSVAHPRSQLTGMQEIGGVHIHANIILADRPLDVPLTHVG